MGFFSTSRTIVIDATPPAWSPSPVDQILELGQPFCYDLNASDAWGIASWSVNDSARFAIDTNGVIADEGLYVGTFWLKLTVYDQVGHSISATFSVTVQDTTAPVWVIAPTDQVLDYGVGLQLDLTVHNISRVKSWEINDTVTFYISHSVSWFEGKNATITNQTTLIPGVYGLAVTVYDFFDHHRSASFTVTVRESTTTTTSPPIPGFPLPAVVIGICTALIPIVALRRQRRP